LNKQHCSYSVASTSQAGVMTSSTAGVRFMTFATLYLVKLLFRCFQVHIRKLWIQALTKQKQRVQIPNKPS